MKTTSRIMYKSGGDGQPPFQALGQGSEGSGRPVDQIEKPQEFGSLSGTHPSRQAVQFPQIFQIPAAG
jgi:hypothetical protein